MARTRNADDPADVGIPVMEGQEAIPDWAVTDPAHQEVAAYSPLVVEQYRRKLAPDELLKWVADAIATFEEDDPRMAMEIAAQVAQAGTVDEVLGAQETTKGRNILDVGLQVGAIKFTMSTEEAGCPYFALLSVRNLQTQELDTISVGGWRLVLQLGQLHYMCAQLPAGSPYLVAKETEGAIAPESYPLFVKIMQAKTQSGRNMNYLAPLV